MINHATTQLFFDNMEVASKDLIGSEGEGFQYILSGMNAEEFNCCECVGDAKWFIEKATAYAKERKVFGDQLDKTKGPIPYCSSYSQMRAAIHLKLP